MFMPIKKRMLKMNISTISNYVPKIRIASPEQAVKNLTKIAIPAIAFVGASMIHGAQAISYVECHNNCDKHRDAHELAKLICYIACMIFAKD
jgi:hypothetical protein